MNDCTHLLHKVYNNSVIVVGAARYIRRVQFKKKSVARPIKRKKKSYCQKIKNYYRQWENLNVYMRTFSKVCACICVYA